MKNFSDFTSIIRTEIASAFENAVLNLQTITKASGSYEGLTVKTDNTGVCPVLNLTSAYKKYENGTSIDEIIDGFIDMLENIEKPSIDTEAFRSFEAIRSKVYPRVINRYSNEEYLSNKPHIDLDDISVMFVVRVMVDANGVAEAIVDDTLQSVWNVTTSDLMDTAISNIEREEPIFSNIEDMIFGGNGTPSTIETATVGELAPMFVLTNQSKTRGANLILSKKVLDRITARFGDFYIIPSSIHEVLILPTSTAEELGRDVIDIVEMIKNVNENEVREEERLSEKLYKYTIETKELATA